MPLTEKPHMLGGRADGTVYDHPAFGQISVHRISGKTRLYGSELVHHSFIRVTISGSSVIRNLSREWFHSSKEKVVIDMSEAQWATFVSSFNSGDGVPCTLVRISGAPVEPLPWSGTGNKETFRQEMQAKIDKVAKALVAMKEKVGRSPNMKPIRDEINAMVRELTENLPFMAEQFESAMEDIVEKSKTEIHAYGTNHMMDLGRQALASQIKDGPVERIEGPTLDEEGM